MGEMDRQLPLEEVYGGCFNFLPILRLYLVEGGHLDIDKIPASMFTSVSQRKFRTCTEQPVIGYPGSFPSRRSVGMEWIPLPELIFEEMVEIITELSHVLFQLLLLRTHQTH